MRQPFFADVCRRLTVQVVTLPGLVAGQARAEQLCSFAIGGVGELSRLFSTSYLSGIALASKVFNIKLNIQKGVCKNM